MSDPRQIGVSRRILVAKTVQEFRQHFAEFVKDLADANFPFVGFNCRWNSPAKGTKRKSDVPDSKSGDNGQEIDLVRKLRTNKFNAGQIALLVLSNIAGLTLLIRTSHFPSFPQELKSFIEGPVCKVGFGLRKDMYKIWEEAKIQLKSYVDLRNVLLDWDRFRKSYHFQRFGTHSVASFLFHREIHNAWQVRCIDWYSADLTLDETVAASEHIQLDVDLFAKLMIERLNLTKSDGTPLTIFDAELFSHENVQRIESMICGFKHLPFNRNAVNFLEMPQIRKKFDKIQRRNLPPGNWTRVELEYKSSSKSLEKKFGCQPFLAFNVDVLRELRVNDVNVFYSQDAADYKLTLELVP